MPHELLHGSFLLEVFQMKNAEFMTYRELYDSLWDFFNETDPFALAEWMEMVFPRKEEEE
jgi:hypothetical protein